MILQLTSGIGGPRECTYALAGIFRRLEEEFPDIQVADAREARDKDCFTSIVFTTDEDLSFLEGSLLWVGTSPFRPPSQEEELVCRVQHHPRGRRRGC